MTLPCSPLQVSLKWGLLEWAEIAFEQRDLMGNLRRAAARIGRRASSAMMCVI